MANTKKPFSNEYHIESSFENGFFFNDTSTYIHPTALIGPNVILGPEIKIGPYCIIIGNVKIGRGTRIYSHVTIGFPAQDTGTDSPQGTIEIGSYCHIREFASIHSPKIPNGKTVIGNSCYLMNYAHVAHDVVLEDNVILINNVNLGGHSYIEKNVMLMANAAVHQFCRIGAFSALAPFSATRQDLPPYCLFTGQPAGFAGLNSVGLRRAQFEAQSLYALKKVTRLFYQQKHLLKNIEFLLDPHEKNDHHVQLFLSFIASSKRGVSRSLMPSIHAREMTQKGEL